jgi:hypothetical protein
MPEYQEGNKEIERWLRFKKEEDFVIAKAKGYAYFVNGKKTNIKFAHVRPDGTFWFSIGRNQLDDMDVFVWLCQKAENYYAIPRENMKQLATRWFSSKYNRFHFRLDTKSHEYISHTSYNISDYYQNNSNSHSPFR